MFLPAASMPSPDICPNFCQILNVFLNVCQIMKYLFQQIVSKSEISSQAFQKLYNENWLWPYNMEAIRVLYPFLCVIPRSSLNPGGAIF